MFFSSLCFAIKLLYVWPIRGPITPNLWDIGMPKVFRTYLCPYHVVPKVC